MFTDKRKSVRRPMHYTAWIAQQGKDLQGCALADISDTGARLNIKDAAGLTDEFILCLSNRGSSRRKCKIAWRSKTQVGVKFDYPLSAKMTNTALMNMLAAKRAREVELAAAERDHKAKKTGQRTGLTS
jgi:hypothetical protein